MNPEQPPWNLLLFPNGHLVNWRVQDALILRSTCKSFRIHGETTNYLALLLSALSGKQEDGIPYDQANYFKHLFTQMQRACILHSYRKLVRFIPQVVAEACSEAQKHAYLYDCAPNGAYANNRRAFEEWLSRRYSPHETDKYSLATISGSFALKHAEKSMEYEVNDYKTVDWCPGDIDVFIHGGGEAEQNFVYDSVEAFCKQVQQECVLTRTNFCRIEVCPKMNDYRAIEGQEEGASNPNLGDTLFLNANELVQSSRIYMQNERGGDPSQYPASILKRRNRGHVYEYSARVLDQLEEIGWMDDVPNKMVGIEREYSIFRCTDISCNLNDRYVTFYDSEVVDLSINIIQYNGQPLTSRKLVSSFDLLPCMVWIEASDVSASGFKTMYADDTVKECIQNKTLKLSPYAFQPNYGANHALLFAKDSSTHGWFGPVKKQTQRIVKYQDRGYEL